jgi:beta-glucanase (GH16 family)
MTRTGKPRTNITGKQETKSKLYYFLSAEGDVDRKTVRWYDPAAVTTNNGALEIMLSAKPQHGLNFTGQSRSRFARSELPCEKSSGGIVSTWNKFCFTGGLVEVAVTLPGSPTIPGFWPAVWTMGNLGRVGYGASTDGLVGVPFRIRDWTS